MYKRQDYDDAAEDNQNICSVFIGKKSVCAGYSKAMQYLMEKQGLFCTYVTGEVTESFSDGDEMCIRDRLGDGTEETDTENTDTK